MSNTSTNTGIYGDWFDAMEKGVTAWMQLPLQCIALAGSAAELQARWIRLLGSWDLAGPVAITSEAAADRLEAFAVQAEAEAELLTGDREQAPTLPD